MSEKTMPTWTVARNCSGSVWKPRMVAALRFPSSASSCIRLLRVESTATSAAEKKPTSRIRQSDAENLEPEVSIDGWSIGGEPCAGGVLTAAWRRNSSRVFSRSVDMSSLSLAEDRIFGLREDQLVLVAHDDRFFRDRPPRRSRRRCSAAC